ncbi:MAG: organic hydroperoxide resistance protein [Polyangiaceae bacterium]|nr:organic hydroperoxide resistance protein [Polyangiaceae bacterium]
MTTKAQIKKVLYTAKTHTTGGREGGTSRTDDGRIDLKFSAPGEGTGTNPEQLFAAGWSTCYLSAIKLIAQKRKITLPDELAIDTEVDLGSTTDGHFALGARLTVNLPGVAADVAQDLVNKAHEVCPYSRATRGNIDVTTTVTGALPMKKAG